MTTEDRLREALHRADQYAPSPDLFARVRRSIEEDLAHRRRVRQVVAATLAGVLALGVWIAWSVRVVDGRLVVPWWAVEVAVDAVLVALVVVLGPLIKRFGKTYVGNVFRANPSTGERFLALFDIAYYLIFVGYILVTTRYAPQTTWLTVGLGAQLRDEAVRLGGLLLLMGVLHEIAIGTLPVIGLLFSSGWWRAVRAELGAEAPPPSRSAETADRVATVIVWVAAALAVLGILVLVVPQLIFGLGGA
jgi:hypothetical protein